MLEETLIANLRFAAGRLKQAGIKLLIEAINPIDIPGFFLNITAQALDIIARTGSDNLFVQHDTTTCGSPRATWRAPWTATSP